VSAIVMLAIEPEAQVTAEGVETTSELETLRRLGVTTVQGYLLARPSVEHARVAAWQTRDWISHAGLTGPSHGVEDTHRSPGPATRT
jgi:EAL domain-containing protein (putative c-di-GMP-specific phosphodiesterase class I)